MRPPRHLVTGLSLPTWRRGMQPETPDAFGAGEMVVAPTVNKMFHHGALSVPKRGREYVISGCVRPTRISPYCQRLG